MSPRRAAMLGEERRERPRRDNGCERNSFFSHLPHSPRSEFDAWLLDYVNVPASRVGYSAPARFVSQTFLLNDARRREYSRLSVSVNIISG